MFPLGHVGITVGTIYIFQKYRPSARPLDYRIVILLSMVPDVFDKFIGLVLLSGSVNNGRLIFHTPLLAMLSMILIRRLYPINWQKYSFPVWIHLILDRVLEDPFYILWPLLGWEFDATDWEIGNWTHALFHDYYTIFGEIFGGLILLYLAISHRLLHYKNMVAFFKKGHFKACKGP